MRRCPICNSEMIIKQSHVVEVCYKIVDGHRGKTPIKVEKPSDNNLINSKMVCQNCQYTEGNR